MKDQRERKTRTNKKPYTKPEIKQVPLRPEEAVLGGCKTASTSNSPNLGGDCDTPGLCYTLLS